MEAQSSLHGAILLLLTGSLCGVVSQQCDLTFNLSVSNLNNAADFVGLAASERVDVGGNITGSTLTCSCPTIAGLPAQWQGPGTFDTNYTEVLDHPGTTVRLDITTTMFSCAAAGNYTCVIGDNMRQVLVLPVGEDCSPTNVTITPSPSRPLGADEAVTLQCSAVDPTGSGLSYRWFKDDVPIVNESSSALVLSAVGPDEVGVYACQASNRLGMEKQTYDLTSSAVLPGSLTLEITNATVCFNKAVQLRCQHQVLPSGMFATARPSWKEDGVVLAIDGGMYRSVTWINETHTVLELVPEQSRFEPSGAHNYTCFLPLVEGGELESNPVEVRPQDKPRRPETPSSSPGIWEARIHWNRSDDQCFESQSSCGLEYSISWTVSSGGSLYSATVPYPENEYTITGLRPSTEYTVNVTAQCQVDTALTSKESTILFTTEDSRSATLNLTAINDTTCFEMPVYLQCDHPDTASNIEGNPVFDSSRVNWKKNRAVIAVDGSMYRIVQQSRSSTTLAVTYHREDCRDTTSKFTCFIPLDNGTVLESNEVKVHLNVSYARHYTFTATGQFLDLSPIIACSPLVTPATNFNVTFTYILPTGNSPDPKVYSHVTNQTSINLTELVDVRLPYDGGFNVILHILEDEPDAIELVLNSSERYACLGETYKLNCTSTKAFNECGVSLPNWYKDGNIIACTNGCSNRKAYDNKTEEISVQIPHSFQNDSVYYCASGNKRRQPKCLSNDFPVQPLRQPLCPVIQNYSSSPTTLSLTWTHNKVCFSHCVEYNISWWTPLITDSSLTDVTNYTIEGLQSGQNYSVQVCAVCEGYPPNCTEVHLYSTQPVQVSKDATPAIIGGTVGAVGAVLLTLAICIASICLITWCVRKGRCSCQRLSKYAVINKSKTAVPPLLVTENKAQKDETQDTRM